MKRKSTVISFRCPMAVARDIDDARKPLDLSRGDWTRNAVLTQLLNADQQLILDHFDDVKLRLSELQSDLHHLSRNLSKATYLLLTREGLSEAEAKELVQRVLGTGEARK